MESALSTLSYLPDETQVKAFMDKLRNEIESGERNPLELKLMARNIKALSETIEKDEVINECIMREANKYPEKTFDFRGFKITKSSRSSYDYSTCKDSTWEMLDSQVKALSEQKKEREKFLQVINNNQIADSNTGEIILPPAKRTTDFLTIKR